MKTMQVVVGGGGSASDEAEVLARFAAAVGDNGRVLHLPWAQAEPGAPQVAAWACSTLAAHRVNTATSLDAVALDLDSYDGVFMGGGNTFLLVHRLRETGLASRLVRAIQEGLPCYGGSAGAIALGAHIGTCAHMDNDEIGLSDLRGLDLVGGCAVWCHYRSSDAARVRAFGRRIRRSVLTISENAGFSFDGSELTPIGPGVARVWEPTTP